MALCLESGYTSLNKKNEELCGDNVESTVAGGYTTLVLADGMGSGVKANILSTLTSKILCTMVAENIDIEECVETIVQSLPACKVRGVAYSTFSVIHMNEEGKGYLFEFDNPQAILVRDCKCRDFERQDMDVLGKTVYKTSLDLRAGDIVVVMSDGVIHAGIGQTLNLGWQRPEVMEFLDNNVKPGMSARAVACLLAGVCNDLYLGQPGDDTTVAAVKVREKLKVSLMIGPPVDKSKDDFYISFGGGEKGRLRRNELADRGAASAHVGAGVLRFPRPRRAAHRLYRRHRSYDRGSADHAQAVGTFGKICGRTRSDPQDVHQKGRRVPSGAAFV